jgi:anti-sigma factor RsiW
MASGRNHSSGGPCQDLLGQVSDYVDGEMEAALCAELEAHLADCPNCRVMVDTVRKTVTLYHSQATTELPADVQNRLYKVLKLEG